MKWGEHTHKCLVHTKFPAHLAVFSLSVCTAQYLVYCAHQLEKKYSTPVTTRCALTTAQKVVSAHLMMQVCTNHQVDSVCSTLNSASVLSTPYIECLVHTM